MKQIFSKTDKLQLRNLKKAYPPMPAEIYDMIQREVAIRTGGVSTRNDISRRKGGISAKRVVKFSWKKAAALVLTATMALGVTALANGAIGRFRVRKEGKYALNVGVSPAVDAPSMGASSTDASSTDASSTDASSTDASSTDNSSVSAPFIIPSQIPRLSVKAGYIPEGYCFSTAISTLGEEITEEGFPLTIDYVLYSEEIPWQDRTALYVEIQEPYETAPMKRIYIPLPEYWQGLIVYAWENTSKEEMIKYAENLEVIREEGTYESAGRLGWVEHTAREEASLDYGTWTVPAERILNRIHPVGETFPLLNTIRKVSVGAELAACVKKVEVFDDFALLDTRYLDATALELLDENQKLKPNQICYMSKGDGISSLSTEVATQTVAQKLVYVTVEYTNISDRDLQDIEDGSCFCRMIEKDGSFVLYDRALEDGDFRTDYIMENEGVRHGRMIYCDASIGDDMRECRVIPEIKAGESVTVHVAGVVNEDELDKLYLNFAGGEREISEWTLAAGYVDLRH